MTLRCINAANKLPIPVVGAYHAAFVRLLQWQSALASLRQMKGHPHEEKKARETDVRSALFLSVRWTSVAEII